MIPNTLLNQLEWHEEYSVKDQAIDLNHQHLLIKMKTLVSAYATPNNSNLSVALSEMIGALKIHFETEDHLVNQLNVSKEASAEHTKHHQEFLEIVGNYKKDLVANAAVSSKTILNMIARDLIEHIKIEAAILKQP